MTNSAYLVLCKLSAETDVLLDVMLIAGRYFTSRLASTPYILFRLLFATHTFICSYDICNDIIY